MTSAASRTVLPPLEADVGRPRRGGRRSVRRAITLVAIISVAVLLRLTYLRPALVYVDAAILASAIVGILSGVLPARRATQLDPIEALRAE